VLTAPAVALTGFEPDPIFAAIARHRAAAAAFNAVVGRETALWEELPRDKRKALCRDDDASTDDPRWQEFRRCYSIADDQMDEAAQQLFEAPTSVAGLVVLVDYLDEVRARGNGDWDDAWSLPESENMLSAITDAVRRLSKAGPYHDGALPSGARRQKRNAQTRSRAPTQGEAETLDR
jgi:hypothetical protein